MVAVIIYHNGSKFLNPDGSEHAICLSNMINVCCQAIYLTEKESDYRDGPCCFHVPAATDPVSGAGRAAIHPCRILPARAFQDRKYRVGRKLVDEKDSVKLQDAGNPVCASVRVCRGTPDEHVTFIIMDEYGASMEYVAERVAGVGRTLEPNDLFFTKQKMPSAPIDISTVADCLNRLVKDSGVEKTYARSGRGHNIPIVNGFRHFWTRLFQTL